jgi:prefoldin subunit 5
MASESIEIIIIESYTDSITNMRKATAAFNKDITDLSSKLNSLSKIRLTLIPKVDSTKAASSIKSLGKQYTEIGDEAGKLSKKLGKVDESIQDNLNQILESIKQTDKHPAEYKFDVKFVGTVGTPPNMDDLTAAIEDIKPAHLIYTYIILYRMHGELAGKTHGELSAYTHNRLREGALN